MTIVAPEPLPVYQPEWFPLPQVTPFTFRDGQSFLERLERAIYYLNNTVIPYINDTIQDFSTEFIAEINTLIQQVNDALTAQSADVDSKINDLTTFVNNSIATNTAYVDSNVASLTTYVDTQTAASKTYVDNAVASIIDSTIAVSDPVIDGVLTTPSSQSIATLNTMYGVPVSTPSMVLFGDSWEYFNYGDPWTLSTRPSPGSRGYATNGNIMLGMPFTIINRGVGGQDTNALLARAATDLVAVSAGWALIGSGTNDISNGLTLTQIKNNLTALYQLAWKSGKRVVARTVPPRTGATSAQQLLRAQINSWLRNFATTNSNFILVDIESAVMDPTTNDFVTGYSIDGVHLTNMGGVAAGAAFQRALAPFVQAVPNVLPSSGALNLLKNNGGSFPGADNAVPTGWTANGWTAGAPVYSKVARTDIPGNWQQLVVPSDSRGFLRSTVLQMSLGEFAVGDTVRAAVEFQADTMEIAPNANSQSIYIQLEYFDGTTTTYQSGPEWFTGEQENMGNRARSGTLLTPWFTIPAGGSNQTLAMTIQARCGGTYRFGRATLAKQST